MADSNPGLQPRKLQGEMEISVESNRVETPVAAASNEQPQPKSEVKPNVEENTPTPSETTETVEAEKPAVEDKEFSERASRRFQELSNAAKAEKERAERAEEMLRRMVDVKPPQPSQNEMLAKQFKSYNSELGYPTDPREYNAYVSQNARLEARREAEMTAQQIADKREMDELIKYHPEVTDDTILQGAIASERTAAKSKGLYLSYKDAADRVKDRLTKKYANAEVTRIAKDVKDKNEAYVETTRGASSNRSPEPAVDPNKMSLKDMEAYLKKEGYISR